MSGDEDRQSELAREHRERQSKRAAEDSAKGKRNVLVGAGVAIVLVAGGVVAATTLLGDEEPDTTKAAATSSPSPSASQSAALPSASPTRTGPVSCSYTKDTQDVPQKFVGFPPKRPDRQTLRIKTMTLVTNHGDIVIEVDPKATPCTVNSMNHLAKKNFYDNTRCHRLVTPETAGLFLLQCGDPLAKADGKNPTDGTGTSGYVFPDEAAGTVAYSKGVVFLTQPTDAEGRNSSQFAISLSDQNTQLDPVYSLLGVAKSGIDTLVKVAENGVIENKDDITGDGGSTAPKTPVVIKDVKLSTK
ncbi:peptidylprolyl isomerase [Nonomuraea longicatena]|uniref:PPIase cyclophilin-type domain-containing protein n=1 Tax=Nonomuraea longicatena TaxID=83682 RepID=A0ABP4ACA1_9ACTN